VLTILSELPRGGDADRVFPIGTVVMLELLKRLRPDTTVHGFRSTFRDWVSECTSYRDRTAEFASAHSLKDKTEAAYMRGELLEKRHRPMRDWERFCNAPFVKRSAKVLPMG
jgi:integrase